MRGIRAIFGGTRNQAPGGQGLTLGEKLSGLARVPAASKKEDDGRPVRAARRLGRFKNVETQFRGASLFVEDRATRVD